MTKSYYFPIILSLTAISFFLCNQPSNKVDHFQLWKKQFGTPFEPSEEIYRRLIFQANLQKIQSHNSDLTQTYKMGINQFTIFTQKQFQSRFLTSLNPTINITITKPQIYLGPNIQIDWTTKGAVSPVKNQGQCGSCWAFSAIASTQSWALLNNKFVSLSEQQLVDCSDFYGNAGCNGGWASRALSYIKDHGISTEAEYPYRAQNQKCQKKGGDFKIKSVTAVFECKGLQNAIVQRPVSVSVDASNWSHYSSGVFDNCGHSNDHAVLLVGVVQGAWKIKNSWGKTWGQNGFIRLAGGNTCGLCTFGGSYPH